ncbi:FKBP-type peptidyl-prolyl cis-trans isomerase [Candidatus Saccharibacteria bacterium]|nr:FKBP-type peptidyl-prolyl cis-trans isomerase [Candidatus Saccharibacteria bacterium]
MDEKLLKTSPKQRIITILIAVLLLGSTIAAYVAIVVSSGAKTDTDKLEEQYTAKQTEINEYAVGLSETYFKDFSAYKSRVKAYNSEKANSVGVQKTDLKEGTGRELAKDDNAYFAYYIGWCPDGSVFDSSFDDNDSPTSLKAPLYAGQGLIDGWNEGVIGMKLGGVREIQMPGELAYGESQEICGATNSPLKFVVMPITDDTLMQLEADLEGIYSELISAYYSSNSSSTSTTAEQ